MTATNTNDQDSSRGSSRSASSTRRILTCNHEVGERPHKLLLPLCTPLVRDASFSISSHRLNTRCLVSPVDPFAYARATCRRGLLQVHSIHGPRPQSSRRAIESAERAKWARTNPFGARRTPGTAEEHRQTSRTLEYLTTGSRIKHLCHSSASNQPTPHRVRTTLCTAVHGMS
ncbi:hypothetical protein PENSPDRAFT_112316 [Peniophora sp. CONT]|nr:hypothetical protein PENSPDRAFT_112316 [Peniophora sp. CONT]